MTALMTRTLDPPPRLSVVFRERGRPYLCSRVMSAACTCQVCACGTGAVKGGGGKQVGTYDSPLELARFPSGCVTALMPCPGLSKVSSLCSLSPMSLLASACLSALSPCLAPPCPVLKAQLYSMCTSAPLIQKSRHRARVRFIFKG